MESSKLALLVVLVFTSAADSKSTSPSSSSTKPVVVGLYYESYCPDCMEYIGGQLSSTWKELGATGIMDAELYPYGNAHQDRNPDGSWNFTCQHGPNECLGNAIEACIIERFHHHFPSYFPTIACVENNLEHGMDPEKAAKPCVNREKELDWTDVVKCAKGPEGNEIVHEYALKTESLVPSHYFVPWVTLDGRHDDHIQSRAERDLAGLVCDEYKGGDKPKACHKKEEEEADDLAWMDRVDIAIL